MTSESLTRRILDANANRATEGLRVVEEYVRFVLGDRHLTSICKQLRHDLGIALAAIPMVERLVARDLRRDVGTQLSATDEYARASLHDVWFANQKRAEQAIRCLEEFAKLDSPETAAAIEQIRYRAYTLAKGIACTERGRERLAHADLYLLLDGAVDIENFSRIVEALVAAEAPVLQLRDKKLADRELLDRARRLRALTRGTSTLFIMNDRPDLAVLADADGVHVGQEELTVAEVREVIGLDRLVGVSTHSVTEAREAVLAGADYLGCGPTFPSTTKSFAAFPGLEFLRQVAAEITLPAFAIGGVTKENLPSVLQTGCSRIAVSNAITSSATPETAVQELLAILRHSRPG